MRGDGLYLSSLFLMKGEFMLSTKLVFKYTLHTGHDIFDDFNELDRQQALRELGEENDYANHVFTILDRLESIGVDVDTLELNEILKPTIEVENEVETTDPRKKDFIPDVHITLNERAIPKQPKRIVKEAIKAMVASDHINDYMLLEAPYDMAMMMFSEAMKAKSDAMKRKMKG